MQFLCTNISGTITGENEAPHAPHTHTDTHTHTLAHTHTHTLALWEALTRLFWWREREIEKKVLRENETEEEREEERGKG